MPDRLNALRDRRRQGKVAAVISISFSHPLILQAAMEQALAGQAPLLVEATSHPWDPFGIQGDRTPAQYRREVLAVAGKVGFPQSRILFAADRLGPAWFEPGQEAQALEIMGEQVEACVLAGFRKIRLDATGPFAREGEPYPLASAAQRAAALCARAEQAFAAAGDGPPPVYGVGADVNGDGAATTAPQDLEHLLDLTRGAMMRAGVGQAWERVVAVVAQPGVGFSESAVRPYDPAAGAALGRILADRAPWMLEVRSTDFQHPGALLDLVGDGAGILGVGPWLTYTFRETLFALEDIAGEIHGAPAIHLREVLDQAMRSDPVPWQSHPRPPAGNPGGGRGGSRLFGYHDRSSLHWQDREVAAEVERLLAATARSIPLHLLEHHLPGALDAVLDGRLEPAGRPIVLHAVQRVLGHYEAACGGWASVQ